MDPRVTRVMGWLWGQEQRDRNRGTGMWGQEQGERDVGTRMWLQAPWGWDSSGDRDRGTGMQGQGQGPRAMQMGHGDRSHGNGITGTGPWGCGCGDRHCEDGGGDLCQHGVSTVSPCPTSAQGDRGVAVLKISVLHQCCTGDSLGTDTTPHPLGAAAPAGPPPPSPVPSPFQPRPSASLVSPRGMLCPCPAVPSPVVALAGWCPLSPAGAQTTQLLVEPPWTPAVLWDPVTLTCQGLGTTGDTTWYRDWWQLWQEASDQLSVTESGIYMCERPGSGLSPSVRVLDDRLVLQVPARPLLEGDTVTLRCRVRQDMPVSRVEFYRDEKDPGGSLNGPELSLSPLQLHHSGRYHCRGWLSLEQTESAPVTVTVQGVPPSGVSLSAQPPGGQVALGDRLVLSCAVAAGTGPLSFTWHRGGSGAPLGTGPRLELWDIGDNDSGHYHCRVSDGDSVAESVPLNVTVLVPVANATITPGPLSHQVHTGDPVTLRCSVQVGSAPVTFTWLHNGQEVARGPVLELGDIDVTHSGTYQCVATNQLGQDGHRVFRALSPELALEVTSWGHWGTAVAVNVGRTLLFLVLLLAVIGGCHWWHHLAAKKSQHRAPPEPLAPLEEGEVLDTHRVRTECAEGSPHAVPPKDPQVTDTELPGPHGQDTSDI
ncbi:Fc receptor-like protein 4 [Prinia subflava]|uniref:Fc receptor-like protein 4 n=1 Tax=Prinia subflava TaxID=208062 RepID=UPI002FE27785